MQRGGPFLRSREKRLSDVPPGFSAPLCRALLSLGLSAFLLGGEILGDRDDIGFGETLDLPLARLHEYRVDGYSAHGGELALTLIKSGTEPNPEADRGEHEFTYALYPHAGDWRHSDVPREAYFLNQPVQVENGGCPGGEFSFVSCGSTNVVIETVKRAEDGCGVVMRVYEDRNTRTEASFTFGWELSEVFECDLLEKRKRRVPFSKSGFVCRVLPYEIKTFRLCFREKSCLEGT